MNVICGSNVLIPNGLVITMSGEMRTKAGDTKTGQVEVQSVIVSMAALSTSTVAPISAHLTSAASATTQLATTPSKRSSKSATTATTNNNCENNVPAAPRARGKCSDTVPTGAWRSVGDNGGWHDNNVVAKVTWATDFEHGGFNAHQHRREHSSNSMSEVEEELADNMERSDDNHDTDTADSNGDLDLDLDGVEASQKRGNFHRQRHAKSMYGVRPNCNFGPKASIMKTHKAVITIQDPACQRLNWYKPPLTVLVIKKIFDDSIRQSYIDLIIWLIKEKQMLVFIESKVLHDPRLQQDPCFAEVTSKLCTFKEGEDDLTDKIDLIVCLGGDGTLIYASSLFQQSVPPVMAFHLGSLGFLSPFEFTNATEKVTQVLEGNVPLTLRTRLKCVICKKGSKQQDSSCSIKHVESKQHILVMNEVVIDRGPSPYLCNLDLYIEHKYITSVQGDGLIISTPTGSTAYAAAAGASMVHPSVPAIIIAPICAHSLSFRPIIVPAGVEIKIVVSPDARNNAWVSFDGRRRQEIFKGDTLRIGTSIYPVPAICNEDQISDWFDSLARCLHWNVRKPQLAFNNSACHLDEDEVSQL